MVISVSRCVVRALCRECKLRLPDLGKRPIARDTFVAHFQTLSRQLQRNGPRPQKLSPPPHPVTTTQANRNGTNNRYASPQVLDPSAQKQLASLMATRAAGERVVLYKSPSHTALFIYSFLCGGGLLLGAVLWSDYALKDRKDRPAVPYLLKALTMAEVLFITGVGTFFLLTPAKMIKKVTIIKDSAQASARGSGYALEFEIKRMLPLVKPDILRTSLDKVSMNRNIKTATIGLKFRSIPMSEIGEFSKDVKSKPGPMLGSFASFGGALLKTWPVLKRETRRMFLRDQIAHIKIGNNGKFKLDLQGSELLDGGRPLAELIRAEESSPSWAQTVFG